MQITLVSTIEGMTKAVVEGVEYELDHAGQVLAHLAHVPALRSLGFVHPSERPKRPPVEINTAPAEASSADQAPSTGATTEAPQAAAPASAKKR
jgi:hypothetical protein